MTRRELAVIDARRAGFHDEWLILASLLATADADSMLLRFSYTAGYESRIAGAVCPCVTCTRDAQERIA